MNNFFDNKNEDNDFEKIQNIRKEIADMCSIPFYYLSLESGKVEEK